MGEPRIRVKVNLFHDVRNHDADVSSIEEQIESGLNSRYKKVENVRIAVGRSAGAVFITLSDLKFSFDDHLSERQIKSIVRRTVNQMEHKRYAQNIDIHNIRLDATEV